MPGVLVGVQTFPSGSRNLNPIFQNATILSPGEEATKAVCAPPKIFHSDLNDEDCFPRSFVADQGLLNAYSFYGTEYFNSPPMSPDERGSTRIWNADFKDESGQKVFPRTQSKLGSCNSIVMNGELAFRDISVLEGFFPKSGGDVNGSLKDHLAGDAISIPMANAYEHSCNSGAMIGSPILHDTINAVHKFLPSNSEDIEFFPVGDVYSSDEFRMYAFKVRRCMRGRSHDWTECPFAHAGEKARRRDPRRFHYSGTACPDFRKGSCTRGDACEFAHGVFECWLHPARYRTQPCKDGRNCKRKVCFFAHTSEQFRLLPGAVQHSSLSGVVGRYSPSLEAPLAAVYDGSPLREALSGSLDGALALESLTGLGRLQGAICDGACDSFVGSPRSCHLGLVSKSGLCCSSQTSPTSTLVGHSFSPPPLSPPFSPSGSPPSLHSPESGWSTLSHLSASHQSSAVPSLASLSQNALSQMQPSLTARAQSSGPMSSCTMATHGPPFSPIVPAYRRHLDKVNSIPFVSIPCFEGRELSSLNSPVSVSAHKVPSSQAMNDFIVNLQQLQLSARAVEFNHTIPTWPSKPPSLHSSRSVSTPTKSGWAGEVDHWEVAMGPLQRVESGRDLRAEIYGRLCKGPLESEIPDLGWVNELVK